MSPLLKASWTTLSLLLAATAHGQVLRVDASASPGGNGQTWGSAIDDLQIALATARGDASIQEIWVAAGTYRPAGPGGSRQASFSLVSGVGLYGGFAGGESSRSQRDPQTNVTILSGDLNGDDGPGFQGDSENSLHVVTAIVSDFTTVIDGFTIRDGNADGGTQADLRGGGMLVIVGAPQVIGCQLVENRALRAVGSGGGIFLDSSMATIGECRIANGEALTGGGLSILGGEPQIVACVIEDNEATGGGGVHSVASRPTFENVIFRRNDATTGGGHSSEGDRVELFQCRFEDNSATTGAGFHCRSKFEAGFSYQSIVTMNRCSFARNDASSTGGALYASGGEFGTQVEISHSRFDSNLGHSGGGIGPGGTVVSQGSAEVNGHCHIALLNCEVIDGFQDCLVVQGSELGVGSMLVERTTVVNPVATGRSIVVRQAGVALVRSSILWGVGGATWLRDGTSTLSITHSCVRFGYSGVGNHALDPLFVSFQAGGDFQLMAASPCIDAGDPADPATGFDGFGDPRRLDGLLDGGTEVDMGADEFAPLHLSVTGIVTPGGTVQVDTTGQAGIGGLLLIGTGRLESFVPAFGNLFVDLGGTWLSLPWPTSPSSVPLTVPAALPVGLSFVTQEAGVLGSAGTLSNPLFLTIE
ncbi:MAG: hypothetical protein RL885_33145 [Planctomycetota bacterium]